MSQEPLLLVDGDHLLYRSLSAVEHETNWGRGIWTLHIIEDEAWDAVLQRLGNLIRATKLEDPEVLMCFGSGRSFRRDVCETYKAARREEGHGKRLPMRYAALRRQIVDGKTELKALRYNGLEGDDVLGIMATWPKNGDRVVVVASEDKDLLQIPGLNFRQGKMTTITPEVADFNFYYQILIGDKAVDGWGGCPGVGPVTAEKLLRTTSNHWAAVVNAFKKAKLGPEQALQQARLARILRWSDWDPIKKEPILWTPPSTTA